MSSQYKRHKAAINVMYSNLSSMVKNETFKNKRIYMFGTSKIASMIMYFLKENGVKLEGILDNNEKKQGYIIDGLVVSSPSILEKYYPNVLVLIASSFENEMIMQIKKMGYIYGKNIVKVIDLPKLMEDYSFVDRTGYTAIPENEIKKYMLGIMKYVKNVCDENEIDYYLAYGTLLGAVRHQGFIPWDDDVDIYIKGEDIDRLAELINRSERYEMITCKNNPEFFDNLPIIIDKETIVDLNSFPLQATMGIWADIFPLYGIPDGENEIKNYSDKIKQFEMKKFNELYDDDKCHKATIELQNFISSYSMKESERTGFFLSAYFTKDCMKTEWFSEKKYLLFEGEEFCVPGNYMKILNNFYGDYMELPSENKRGSHHYYKAYYKI